MSKFGTLSFLGVAHFLDHFFLLIFPTAVLVIHLEWGMGYDQALAYGTAVFVAFAAGTLPAGWLGDKWGLVPMMRVYFPALGVTSIATSFANGPVSLAIGLAGIGLAAAIYHPVANALIVRLAKHRGRALATNGVCGNFGVAAAALVTAFLAERYGWRAAFFVPGVVSLVIGLVFIWLTRNQAAEISDASGQAQTDTQQAAPLDFSTGLTRLLVAVSVVGLFGGLVFNGVTIAVPQLLSEALASLDVSLSDVGLVAAVVFAVGGFAQLPVGYLLDKVGPRRILLFLAGCQVPLLLIIGYGPPLLTPFALAILVMLIFGEVPISSWLIGHHVAAQWRSRVYALYTLLGLGVGALAVPAIAIGYAWTSNMALVFALIAPASFCVFLAACILPAKAGAKAEDLRLQAAGS